MNLNCFVCETQSLYSVIITLTPDIEFLTQKAMGLLAVILNTEENVFNRFEKMGSRGMWRKEAGMARQKGSMINTFPFFGCERVYIFFLRLSSCYLKKVFLTCYPQVIYPEIQEYKESRRASLFHSQTIKKSPNQ